MGADDQAVNSFARDSVLKLVDLNEVVIGVDPGDSTGFAFIRPNVCALSTLSYGQMLSTLMTCYIRKEKTTLVIEEFINRPSGFAKKQVAPAICGAADMVEALCDHILVVYQTPQVAKTMIDPDLLKAGGWAWKTSHELDALRHAIYYILTR